MFEPSTRTKQLLTKILILLLTVNTVKPNTLDTPPNSLETHLEPDLDPKLEMTCIDKLRQPMSFNDISKDRLLMYKPSDGSPAVLLFFPMASALCATHPKKQDLFAKGAAFVYFERGRVYVMTEQKHLQRLELPIEVEKVLRDELISGRAGSEILTRHPQMEKLLFQLIVFQGHQNNKKGSSGAKVRNFDKVDDPFVKIYKMVPQTEHPQPHPSPQTEVEILRKARLRRGSLQGRILEEIDSEKQFDQHTPIQAKIQIDGAENKRNGKEEAKGSAFEMFKKPFQVIYNALKGTSNGNKEEAVQAAALNDQAPKANAKHSNPTKTHSANAHGNPKTKKHIRDTGINTQSKRVRLRKSNSFADSNQERNLLEQDDFEEHYFDQKIKTRSLPGARHLEEDKIQNNFSQSPKINSDENKKTKTEDKPEQVETSQSNDKYDPLSTNKNGLKAFITNLLPEKNDSSNNDENIEKTPASSGSYGDLPSASSPPKNDQTQINPDDQPKPNRSLADPAQMKPGNETQMFEQMDQELQNIQELIKNSNGSKKNKTDRKLNVNTISDDNLHHFLKIKDEIDRLGTQMNDIQHPDQNENSGDDHVHSIDRFLQNLDSKLAGKNVDELTHFNDYLEKLESKVDSHDRSLLNTDLANPNLEHKIHKSDDIDFLTNLEKQVDMLLSKTTNADDHPHVNASHSIFKKNLQGQIEHLNEYVTDLLNKNENKKQGSSFADIQRITIEPERSLNEQANIQDQDETKMKSIHGNLDEEENDLQKIHSVQRNVEDLMDTFKEFQATIPKDARASDENQNIDSKLNTMHTQITDLLETKLDDYKDKTAHFNAQADNFAHKHPTSDFLQHHLELKDSSSSNKDQVNQSNNVNPPDVGPDNDEDNDKVTTQTETEKKTDQDLKVSPVDSDSKVVVDPNPGSLSNDSSSSSSSDNGKKNSKVVVDPNPGSLSNDSSSPSSSDNVKKNPETGPARELHSELNENINNIYENLLQKYEGNIEQVNLHLDDEMKKLEGIDALANHDRKLVDDKKEAVAQEKKQSEENEPVDDLPNDQGAEQPIVDPEEVHEVELNHFPLERLNAVGGQELFEKHLKKHLKKMNNSLKSTKGPVIELKSFDFEKALQNQKSEPNISYSEDSDKNNPKLDDSQNTPNKQKETRRLHAVNRIIKGLGQELNTESLDQAQTNIESEKEGNQWVEKALKMQHNAAAKHRALADDLNGNEEQNEGDKATETKVEETSKDYKTTVDPTTTEDSVTTKDPVTNEEKALTEAKVMNQNTNKIENVHSFNYTNPKLSQKNSNDLSLTTADLEADPVENLKEDRVNAPVEALEIDDSEEMGTPNIRKLGFKDQNPETINSNKNTPCNPQAQGSCGNDTGKPKSNAENIHPRILAEIREPLPLSNTPQDRKMTLYLESLDSNRFKHYNQQFMRFAFSHREILYKMRHPDFKLGNRTTAPYVVIGDLASTLFGFRDWSPTFELKVQDILPLIFTDEFFNIMVHFMKYRADKNYSHHQAKQVKRELSKLAVQWKSTLQSASASTHFETMLEVLAQKHPNFMRNIVAANQSKMHKNLKEFGRDNFMNLFSLNTIKKENLDDDCSNCWMIIEKLVKNITRRPIFPFDARLSRPMDKLYPIFISELTEVLDTSASPIQRSIESLKSQFLGSDLLRNYFMDMAHSRVMEEIRPLIKKFGTEYFTAFVDLISEKTPAVKKMPSAKFLKAFLYFSREIDSYLHFNYQNIYDAHFPHRDMYTQSVIFSSEAYKGVTFNASFGHPEEKRQRDIQNVDLNRVEADIKKSGRDTRTSNNESIWSRGIKYF